MDIKVFLMIIFLRSKPDKKNWETTRQTETADIIQFLCYWLSLDCVLRYDTSVLFKYPVVLNTAEALKTKWALLVMTVTAGLYLFYTKLRQNRITPILQKHISDFH